MASNIFNQDDYENLLSRIEGLNVNSRRGWGSMNINQMLVHCSNQLKLGLGLIEQSDFEGYSFLRTGFGRWLFLFALPWTRGLPTPNKMNMIEAKISVGDLESERKTLLYLLDQVQNNPKLLPHPFFGTLDKKNWGRLIWKHLDHHLRQFGT